MSLGPGQSIYCVPGQFGLQNESLPEIKAIQENLLLSQRTRVHGSSQPSVSTVLGDPVPSFGLPGAPGVHVVPIDTSRQTYA